MGDTIFIFCLALIIFGPKKLPEIGRQIGKLMVEFRRASNEFKLQIEEELRAAEQTEQQKQISAPAPTAAVAAMTAAAAASYQPAPEPIIQPPTIGEQVSHSAPPIQSELLQVSENDPAPRMHPTYDQAYPEAASAFETSSNGSMKEGETLSPVPFTHREITHAELPPVEGEIEEQIAGQAQVQHG